MNILGTHDTERALTVLGKQSTKITEGKGSELAPKRLSAKERADAIKRLMLAASIQYTVYGVPSVYYGDEAGIEGYRDPFCRKPYPWGREDEGLLAHYRLLGRMRLEHPALDGGRFLLYLIEGIRRKPLPPDKEGIVHTIGFVLLMGLMIFVLFILLVS